MTAWEEEVIGGLEGAGGPLDLIDNDFESHFSESMYSESSQDESQSEGEAFIEESEGSFMDN